MEIIETPTFTRQVENLLTDDDYHRLQIALANRPDRGDIIPGSGGLRKMRWGSVGRGKRGGVRIIYYWVTEREQILMLFMYPKNVHDNLSAAQLKTLRAIIEEEYP